MLSIRRDRFASRFTHPYSSVTSRGETFSNSPYFDYLGKVDAYFPRVHRGVPDSARVLAVIAGRYTKAYPLVRIARRGIVNDGFAHVPVLLVHREAAESDTAFLRRAGGRTLSFERRAGALVDRETGSRWSPVTGQAVSGPLAGTRLPRLPTITSFWFAWRATHPGAHVYGG